MSDGKVIKVTIDHDLCVGSQMCLGVDPVHFVLNDDAQAIYDGPEIDQDLVREAAEVCPMAAIKLTMEE